MAKKKKIEEVAEKLEDLAEELEDLQDDEPLAQGIVIPANVIEALLVQHDTSNRVGLTSVIEQIRQMAQEQLPEHFKKA